MVRSLGGHCATADQVYSEYAVPVHKTPLHGTCLATAQGRVIPAIMGFIAGAGCRGAAQQPARDAGVLLRDILGQRFVLFYPSRMFILPI